MAAVLSMEAIRKFWTEQAEQHKQSPAASWSDQCVIDMEIDTIDRWLNNGDQVLDVGCANGYSTVAFAKRKSVAIRGLDYIPKMIDEAKARLAKVGKELLGSVEFDEGDILSLKEPAVSYDKVVVIRVLINLGNWKQQLAALKHCARVLKPGGTLLMSEATVEGWRNLNALRREWGLSDIPMPPFNVYLSQTQVIEAAAPELELIEVVDFASTYFVGTRLLKPLLAKALGGEVDVSNPLMHWNRWCSQLPPFGDYGTQKLFVFRKCQ